MAEQKRDEYGQAFSKEDKIELPPKRIYVISKRNPTNPMDIEKVTIEANKVMVVEGSSNTIACLDYILSSDGMPSAEMHRMLFDVVDVEQVMRELSRPGKKLVVN